MGSRRLEPIRSVLQDPDLEERLDAFIVALGEHIDLIQEADAAGDLRAGAERARRLAEEARALGLPPLAESALRVAEACDERIPEPAHKRIEELTEVVQRVRLGHRGAV